MREYDVQGSYRPARAERQVRERRNRAVALVVLIAVAVVLILIGVAAGPMENGSQHNSVQFKVLPLTPENLGTANATNP